MPLDLDEIQSRAEAATPGPWDKWDDSDDVSVIFVPHKGTIAKTCQAWGEHHQDNAAFIAHVRADVPALCQELRDARKALKITELALKRACEGIADCKQYAGEYLAEKLFGDDHLPETWIRAARYELSREGTP